MPHSLRHCFRFLTYALRHGYKINLCFWKLKLFTVFLFKLWFIYRVFQQANKLHINDYLFTVLTNNNFRAYCVYNCVSKNSYYRSNYFFTEELLLRSKFHFRWEYMWLNCTYQYVVMHPRHGAHGENSRGVPNELDCMSTIIPHSFIHEYLLQSNKIMTSGSVSLWALPRLSSRCYN